MFFLLVNNFQMSQQRFWKLNPILFIQRKVYSKDYNAINFIKYLWYFMIFFFFFFLHFYISTKSLWKGYVFIINTMRQLTWGLGFMSHPKDRNGTGSKNYGIDPTWTCQSWFQAFILSVTSPTLHSNCWLESWQLV